MVESGVSGNVGCRCACQTDLTTSEFDSEESEHRSGCCDPQAFTSVLLGILACVLVTGGVFLAFHRWDPMWLIVSGVGIVLIFIGSILHCTSSSGSEPRRQSGAGGGKGCRPLGPDHHHHHHHPNHQLANNGSLTEQLLPLSNARSVSQLSLNMLPGYFPPVVSTYGIEQHSAVVQNINRIVQQQQLQQQQQQQQQSAVSAGSTSPGVVSNAPGKSFILLSLPADTNPASIQNLVATVYQLDGSASSDNAATESSQVATVMTATPVISPAFKNAEVQTCNIFPLNEAVLVANSATTTASTSTDCQPELTRSNVGNVINTASSVTQTEDAISNPIPINLMDCASDPLCDNIQNNQLSNSNGVLLSISEEQSSLLIGVLQPCEALIELPVSEPSNVLRAETLLEMPGCDASMSPSSALVEAPIPTYEVLVDIPTQSPNVSAGSRPELTSNELMGARRLSCPSLADSNSSNGLQGPSSSNAGIPSYLDAQSGLDSAGNSVATENVLPICVISSEIELDATGSSDNLATTRGLNSGLSSSGSADNLSALDVETDDGDSSVGRSSPPPSYEDATNENEAETIGAYGLAYGTI